MSVRYRWLVGLSVSAGLASSHATFAQSAAPAELLCSMRTSGTTATLRVSAGIDPLATSKVLVGESFELRAVALAGASGSTSGVEMIDRVVVTVLGRSGEGRGIVLSQSRWTTASQEVLGQEARWRPTVSGWQRAYLPGLGRELAWGCALVRPGATPEGWDRADATGDDALPAQPLSRVARPAPSTAAVRVAWMGDVMLADGPGRVIANGRDPFAAVMGTMKGADLRIANLECVIATGGSQVDKPWTFRAHPRVLDVLRRHVDAVSLANNHSGDFGPAAFAQMLTRLDRAGLPHFGGGADLRSAHRPVILERQGLRIALLGYNEMFPRQFEAGPDSPGIAGRTRSRSSPTSMRRERRPTW
ncbi:CapA family protein [Roseateles sp.]|uniref:CapA family protein n=1 Tax=Roseateles sp. TaxID=1971397 RepID=UPI002F409E5B